jgi:uncharacterized protein (TIGR00369 family)
MSGRAAPSRRPTPDEEGVAPRSRTYAWDDPAALARAGLERSGLEYLRSIMDGELPPPPIALTLGLELLEVDEGRVVFGVAPHEFLFNPIGSVHGGAIATLIDSAASCAVHSVLGPGVAYATTDLHVTYVRPLLAGGTRAICTGELLHGGRRMATASARVEDEQGRLLAHGVVTCTVLGSVG